MIAELERLPEEELVAAQVSPNEDIDKMRAQAGNQPVIRGSLGPEPHAHPLLRQGLDQQQHRLHCLRMRSTAS